MFERYTEKARRVIFFARYEASQLGAPHIETEHVLLGNEVACVICRWQLQEGDDPERNTGYTNGCDWLCIECYERFLRPGSTQEAG